MIRSGSSFQRTLESISHEDPDAVSRSRWIPALAVSAAMEAARARWVPAFAGTTVGALVRSTRTPSFQRKLESIGGERRDGRRKSKMGPSVRWDDGRSPGV